MFLDAKIISVKSIIETHMEIISNAHAQKPMLLIKKDDATIEQTDKISKGNLVKRLTRPFILSRPFYPIKSTH